MGRVAWWQVYAFSRPQLPEIVSTECAFAARTDWGKVILWGDDASGADAGPTIVSTKKLKGKVVLKDGSVLRGNVAYEGNAVTPPTPCRTCISADAGWAQLPMESRAPLRSMSTRLSWRTSPKPYSTSCQSLEATT